MYENPTVLINVYYKNHLWTTELMTQRSEKRNHCSNSLEMVYFNSSEFNTIQRIILLKNKQKPKQKNPVPNGNCGKYQS